MLTSVTAARIPMLVLASVAVVLAACSSTIAGSGTVSGTDSGPSSSPDFPSSPASGSGGATAPAASGSAVPSTHPVPSAPLRSVTVHAPGGTTYPVQIWADVEDPTCFDHAHGQPVITFLTTHPCTGLHRYLGTTTVSGRAVGFAMSATGFHGPASDPYRYAGQFSTLEEADGTGSIDDLLLDGYRLPAGPAQIPASEAFRVVGQDAGVTVWDAWYLDGTTPQNDPALMRMAQDLFLQF
jgi:hypothetical protein